MVQQHTTFLAGVPHIETGKYSLPCQLRGIVQTIGSVVSAKTTETELDV